MIPGSHDPTKNNNHQKPSGLASYGTNNDDYDYDYSDSISPPSDGRSRSSSSSSSRSSMPNRLFLPKNLNIYWCLMSGLAVWFLFVHSPPILIRRRVYKDLPFSVHLLGSYTVYLSCVFNTLYTPSTTTLPFLFCSNANANTNSNARTAHVWVGRVALVILGSYTVYLSCVFNTLYTPSTTTLPFLFCSNANANTNSNARTAHVWVGRVALVMGAVGVVSGLYCSWWPYREARPSSIGSSIGLSMGGTAQVILQIAGYRAIQKYQRLKRMIEEEVGNDSSSSNTITNEILEGWKKEKDSALRNHILNMIALFTVACGVPAMIRVVDMLPNNSNDDSGGITTLCLVLGIVGLNSLVMPFGNKYLSKIGAASTSTSSSRESVLGGA
eukprot:CAMPEP_0202474274 /NCGR_PEP_ID=MMETSP1360-20130828/92292_1 /ASSEMBLY_ACC=CAM_ASM_000848 /TAXON_ID=515479 /ORGANISM="Licmophora paradoxa, Strain CCMP2313" /LENGTH=383 /DNA_ID=CAMNT_0049101383 /DNA_START=57 /DNA_END=1208 /DNA_ORIENTATION=-